jgi:hypothetical protein
LKGEDINAIRSITSDMQNALNALNTQDAAQAQPDVESGSTPPPPDTPDGEVMEGEFREV